LAIRTGKHSRPGDVGKVTLYEKESVRGIAVQAAAEVLGDQAWYRRDVPGGGYQYLPSPAFVELTSRIGYYVLHGYWQSRDDGQRAVEE
jgi:hypothetical protein